MDFTHAPTPLDRYFYRIHVKVPIKKVSYAQTVCLSIKSRLNPENIRILAVGIRFRIASSALDDDDDDDVRTYATNERTKSFTARDR